MTKQQIRKRRFLKSMGQKKQLIIIKTKRLMKFQDTIEPITYYTWKERFISLFSFKKAEFHNFSICKKTYPHLKV